MQRLRILGAIAAGAAFASGAAMAENGTAPSGVAWRCEGSACSAKATGEAGLVAECRRVVRAVGPVASYVSRGRQLSAAGVRDCNRAARPYQSARN